MYVVGFEFRSGRGVQHYVIKFVSDLRQVGHGFSPGTPVSCTNKTDHYDRIEIFLKVSLNTIKRTNKQMSIHVVTLGLFLYYGPVYCNYIQSVCMVGCM